MIITIGGSIGSGKTTLAKRLAEKFRLNHISAGKIMRTMAEKMGMTIEEFSKYAEGDPEIDLEIDRQQKELSSKGSCVVDGRLSGYFLDSDIKIWLNAPIDVRIERMGRRDKKTKDDAKTCLLEREESEKKRYKEIYGIDMDDMACYDLVINTDRFDVETISEMLSPAIKKYLN